jgi:hypothetical protein
MRTLTDQDLQRWFKDEHLLLTVLASLYSIEFFNQQILRRYTTGRLTGPYPERLWLSPSFSTMNQCQVRTIMFNLPNLRSKVKTYKTLQASN